MITKTRVHIRIMKPSESLHNFPHPLVPLHVKPYFPAYSYNNNIRDMIINTSGNSFNSRTSEIEKSIIYLCPLAPMTISLRQCGGGAKLLQVLNKEYRRAWGGGWWAEIISWVGIDLLSFSEEVLYFHFPLTGGQGEWCFTIYSSPFGIDPIQF